MTNKKRHACFDTSGRKTSDGQASHEHHARRPATVRLARDRFLGGCGLIAMLVVASSGSSFAADLPVSARSAPVPAAVAFNWSGFYVGGNIGWAGAAGGGPRDLSYTLRNLDDSYFNRDESVGNGWFNPQGSKSNNSVIGGVQFGYNYQFGKMVIGAETDFSFLNAKKKYSGAAADSLPWEPNYIYNVTEEMSAQTSLRWLGTVRARLGYTPIERLLAYVTGGVAYGEVRGSGEYNYREWGYWWGGPGDHFFDRRGGIVGSSNEVRWGWTAGAGLEYALTDHVSIRGEYLFVDLGSSSHSFLTSTRSGDVNTDETLTWQSKTRLNIARFGMNYRF